MPGCGHSRMFCSKYDNREAARRFDKVAMQLANQTFVGQLHWTPHRETAYSMGTSINLVVDAANVVDGVYKLELTPLQGIQRAEIMQHERADFRLHAVGEYKLTLKEGTQFSKVLFTQRAILCACTLCDKY